MGFVEYVVRGENPRISREIGSDKIDHIEPFGANDVACFGVFEEERASTILAESVVGMARRKATEHAFSINDLVVTSLKSDPRHKSRPMQPLTLGAMAMPRPCRRHRHLEFHLPAVASSFGVFHSPVITAI